MRLWLPLVPLLMGVDCGGVDPTLIYCDPQGSVTGQVGLCTFELPRDTRYVLSLWNTAAVDEHPNWRVAWDWIGDNGAYWQTAPAAGYSDFWQSASDTPYWYKGPSIWTGVLQTEHEAGDTVVLYPPRIECQRSGGCSGPKPRILLHDLQDDQGWIASWWRSLPAGHPDCDVETPPNYDHALCVRRSVAATRGLGIELAAMVRMEGQRLCLHCHTGAFDLR